MALFVLCAGVGVQEWKGEISQGQHVANNIFCFNKPPAVPIPVPLSCGSPSFQYHIEVFKGAEGGSNRCSA